ncbi:dihydrofolate reductase [Parapedobacter sp. DT-150]|uniref:dihydrofolate reductase n=1 Tax=Parapedobacter sp. DT-150 TaxID=3396162 RepID=UPI003F1E1060
MEKPVVSAIVAAATNGAIGKDNQMLWHLPNDLRFFKRTTSGHPVIMGRKTFESLGKPLPNRRNIIITRQPDYAVAGAEVVHSLAAALERCTDEGAVFIVGGAEIYRQALPIIHRIYLTRVHTSVNGDAYFPKLDETEWTLVSAEDHAPDERHAYGYTFMLYERT